MKLTDKQVQRAKDLAAVKSTEAYMETLQNDLRRMAPETSQPEPDGLMDIADIIGVHQHHAAMMDEHGHMFAIVCTWEIIKDALVVAEIVAHAKHKGEA